MTKFSILLIASLFLISCSKNDDDEILDNYSIAKVESVLSMTGKPQILAYNSLTNQERKFLWNERLKKIQSFGGDDFKLGIIVDLKSKLNSSNFQDKFDKKFYDKMKSKAIKAYGFDLSKKYFASLDPIDALTSKSKEGLDDGGGGGCGCNVADDWCVWGSSCFAGFCGQQNDGCGWWLEEPCIGTCVSNP
jgi:hypothetical protein